MHINLIKYIKIFKPYRKTELSKLRKFKETNNWKIILECILYIEMNKKVTDKTVRKIGIKNVTGVFLISKLIIHKN